MLAIFSSSSQIKAQEDVPAVSPLSKTGSNEDDDFENENISLMWSLMPFQSE